MSQIFFTGTKACVSPEGLFIAHSGLEPVLYAMTGTADVLASPLLVGIFINGLSGVKIRLRERRCIVWNSRVSHTINGMSEAPMLLPADYARRRQ